MRKWGVGLILSSLFTMPVFADNACDVSFQVVNNSSHSTMFVWMVEWPNNLTYTTIKPEYNTWTKQIFIRPGRSKPFSIQGLAGGEATAKIEILLGQNMRSTPSTACTIYIAGPNSDTPCALSVTDNCTLEGHTINYPASN